MQPGWRRPEDLALPFWKTLVILKYSLPFDGRNIFAAGWCRRSGRIRLRWRQPPRPITVLWRGMGFFSPFLRLLSFFLGFCWGGRGNFLPGLLFSFLALWV